MIEATDRKKVVKHLDLSSLKTGQPDLKSRQIDVGSEEELTQMSCGMNIRDTFRDVDSIVGSKFGLMHSTQHVKRDLIQALELHKKESDLSASKQVLE